MERDYTALHAAILLLQLPQTSRVFRAINPNCAWTEETDILASIEHGVWMLIWQRSKDANDKNKPTLRLTPEQRKKQPKHNTQDVDLALVDKVLGGISG